MYVIIAIIALAVLGPLFGRDTRDGLDWARGNFWLPRRTAPDAPVRNPGSHGRGASGHASADARRSVPAGV